MRGERGVRSAIVMVLLACAGCEPGRATAERTILAFVNAVQGEDRDALFCLMAGASQPGGTPDEVRARRDLFDGWVRSRFDAYRSGADAGWVEFTDDGIALTRAFALGKGTYYTVERVTRSEGSILADIRIRFAYGEIDISSLPRGTVFYVCGTPLGRIHPVEIPPGNETVSHELLDTLEVRWTLTLSAPTASCPERWTVASAVPLPETAALRRVRWIF